MPTLTTKACSQCGRPSRTTRCPTHTTKPGYDTTHWQTIRTQRLNHDHHTCQLRHNGCTLRATTVHLRPELKGQHLLATLDTTISACRHCHGVEDAPRASGYLSTSLSFK